MLDAVLDGVIVVDREGRVEQVNAEACRILETSPEAIGGEPIESVLGRDHAMAKLARAALASGRTTLASEQPVERRLDVKLVVDVAASATFDERGTPDGVVLALRDRTIQHSLEQVVTERERLATFGRIAAGIAHEVKNPLGGIRGAAELLELRAADAPTRESARLIVREVDRIATLVDDLMVFSRGEKVQLTPVNLHRLLDDVLDLLAHDPLSANARVERHFDPSLPELLADPDRLVQVFLNLARNALQALEAKGGMLIIRTGVSVDHRLLVDGMRVPEVLIEFEDSGPGIPADLLKKVSTPFFSTRTGGTGLGLAVSKHWVACHGGVLRVESAPGEGTTVRVSLPLRRTE